MDERRTGRIKVNYELLEWFWKIIDNFIVLETTTDEYKTITYTGIHPQFKRLEPGELIPEYEVVSGFDKEKPEYTYRLGLK